MKIVDFESYKNIINKLDGMTQSDTSKISINFQYEDSSKSRMEKFFSFADGNPYWKV
jgi:hypothetical protein